MPTTFSSTEFSNNANKVKRATLNGPVFITDKGKPSHVLMTVEDFDRISTNRNKIADLLAMPDIADVELTFTRLNDLARTSEL